jgi:alpha-glucosidase (family GH31 glycosyl hydrolase)
MDCKYTSAKNVTSEWAFTGSDIGGFAEQPSGELYTRWIQLCFSSFCTFLGDHGNPRTMGIYEEVIDIQENLLTCVTIITLFIHHVLAVY